MSIAQPLQQAWSLPQKPLPIAIIGRRISTTRICPPTTRRDSSHRHFRQRHATAQLTAER